MGKAFYNWDDACMRLKDTVCKYRGKPFFVRVSRYAAATFDLYPLSLGIDEDVPLKYWDKPSHKGVDYRDREFEYNNLRLGYLQHGLTPFFVVRKPLRIQKQGLHADHLMTHEGNNLIRRRYEGQVILSRALHNCIQGTHKTYKDVLEILDKADNIKPDQGFCFHRNFALTMKANKEDFYLRFRGVVVGSLRRGSQLCELDYRNNTSFIMKQIKLAGLDII